MIVLTLTFDDEEVFINPMHIVAILTNDDNETDVVCVDQTVFVVKESPITVFNLINKQIN